MMFVTADDSASAEKKRGATDLVSNGAEEGLKEVLTLTEAEIWWGRCAGRQQIASAARFWSTRTKGLFIDEARR